MSENSLVDIYLVLPIYKGTTLFLGALESIERSGIDFSGLIISFNGDDPADYDDFMEARRYGRLKSDYIVFRTNTVLEAFEHQLFIREKVEKIVSPQSMLFFLAHDDRIISEGNEKLATKFLQSIDRSSVNFPSYNCCIAGHYETVTHILEHDLTLTPEDFFWLTLRQNVDTNMSGMVVPISAWGETLGVMAKAKTGARFEHLLTIAKGVSSVRFHKQIRVLVGERPDSDGKSLSSLQHRKASLLYLIAFARNARLHGIGGYLRFLFELGKKTTALGLCLLQSFSLAKRS